MNKRIIFMSAALAVGGVAATVGTVGVTHAASMNGTTSKTGDRKMHQVREEAKLSQAVKDGVITEAQKTAYLSEVSNLHTEHKAAISKTSTKAEREAERTKLRTELKDWATTNNFPLAKLFPKLAS